MQQNCYLTTRQTADFIGVSVSTLNRMRRARTGPRCVQINTQTYRYRMSEIEIWLCSQSDGSMRHADHTNRVHLLAEEGL